MVKKDKPIKGHEFAVGDILNAIGLVDTVSDIDYNSGDKLHEDDIFNTALKGTAQDRHVVNRLYDIITTGGGLWGKSTAEREIEEGVKHARDIDTDMFSNINNINNLSNAYNINSLPDALQSVHPMIDDGRSLEAAAKINPILQQKREEYVTNFYDQANKINQRQQRQNMMNYFAEGGLLNEFNTGDSHENNPLGGIPQGIASDGLPNLVEEGEVRSDFDDAKIFNNQDRNYTITEKDCEEYLLPKSVIGCNPAEAIKKLKKEYEDRVNDPIAIATMKEWDNRIFAFQEDKTAKLEEKRIKKAIKNMSDEEKDALLSSLEQPMAQQEGIDLGQPMYAKGGKIHIAKNKRGTFTAAAKKHGKSVQAFASQVLANKENYSPAMVKKANFARNFGGHKHAEGGYLVGQTYDVSEEEYNRLISLGYEIERV